MLSLVENVRVFESSKDVIYHASSHHYSQLNNATQRSRHVNNETESEEQLHPQHPYRMRKHVLQRDNEEYHRLPKIDARSTDQDLVSFDKHDSRPMELVFLSSGEIRSREDCPPALGRPQLQQEKMFSSSNLKVRLGYYDEEKLDEDKDEEDKEIDRRKTSYEKSVDRRRTSLNVKLSLQRRQQQVDCWKNERLDSLPSSSSKRLFSSVSEDADVLSDDDNESVASKNFEESRKQNKGQLALQQQTRRATQKADEQVRIHESSVVKTARDGTPTCSLPLDHLRREEGDGTSGKITDKAHTAQHTADYRSKEAPSSGDISHESRQRSAPPRQVPQVSRLDCLNDAPTRRTKRSPKMEVSHLALDEPIPSPKSRTVPSTRREDTIVNRLETELQKEKRRVLEKTTRLLDEQDKNQQLRDRVEVLEAQLAATDSETSSKNRQAAREQEKTRRISEKEQDGRVNELEEQVCRQKADIACLNHDKIQLSTALKQLKKTGSNLSSNQHSDTMEVEGLRAELDDMNRRVYDFLAKVERWKSNSKEELQHCDDKTDLPVLLENVWLDFPQFPEVLPRRHTGSLSPSFEPQQQSVVSVDEQTDVILFLKKRLRQREDELRQTHIKYVELKEMCARQCVREADLQNFINEHRLRGNLIIRKNSSSTPANNQEQVQKDQHDEHGRSDTLKAIPSGDTNTPSSYNKRGRGEKDLVNEEYSDKQEDSGGCEDRGEVDTPLQTPKVFAKVDRDGLYEHASSTNSAVAQKRTIDRSRAKQKMQPKKQLVERIQLVPSPGLAQRYEQVPTPTTTATQGKKLAQQPFIQSMLKECPPGCGSHPSFMRKKAPSAAARTKRPVTTTASKGSVGVIRPWI